MRKNDLLKNESSILRILQVGVDKVLVINCITRMMPEWVDKDILSDCERCTEAELYETTKIIPCDIDLLDAESRKVMHKRYTQIAGILPFVSDKRQRNILIEQVSASEEFCCTVHFLRL